MLWRASPRDFRNIPRPAEIPFPIEGAQTYLEEVQTEAWNRFQVSRDQYMISQQQLLNAQQQQVNNINNSFNEEIGDSTPELDGGGSNDEPDEFDEDYDGVSSRGSPRRNDYEGGNTLTSNDWAYLKYRTHLGGPVLNF
jgi:hypothetical protein